MRHLLHLIVSILMWVLFGYYWYIVMGREVGPGTTRAIVILGMLVLVGLVTTALWIEHNLLLARRLEGRRQGVRGAPEPNIEWDAIGRPITHPGLPLLRAATIVDITADPESKTFTVGAAKEPS